MPLSVTELTGISAPPGSYFYFLYKKANNKKKHFFVFPMKNLHFCQNSLYIRFYFEIFHLYFQYLSPSSKTLTKENYKRDI